MRVVQGVGQAASQLALGVLRVGPIGLILGDVLSRILGAGQLIRSSLAGLRSTAMSVSAVKQAARDRWAFARVLTFDAAASLLAFSIPTYLIVMVAGQSVIVTVFGEEWRLAGLYAQIMAPSLIFWSVANPMSSLPLIGRRERESLFFTVAELGLKVLALGIGAAFESLTLGIVVLSITSVAIEAAAMWRFLRVATVSMGELLDPVRRTVLATLPFVALLVLLGQIAPGILPVAAILAGLGAAGLSFRNSREARSLLSKTYG
jgi:O-antigen/teichoic acid export membrane protein